MKSNISTRSKIKMVFIAIGLISILFVGKFFSSIRNFTKADEDILSLSEYAPINANIEIRYLDSWILFQTPDGNHGDMEIIAVATGIGDSFPGMNVAMRPANSSSNIDFVASWALDRIKHRDIKFAGNVVPYASNFFSGATRDYSYDTHNAITPYITRCKDYYFLIDNNQYIFSFYSEEDEWDKYAQIFDDIMASMRHRTGN